MWSRAGAEPGAGGSFGEKKRLIQEDFAFHETCQRPLMVCLSSILRGDFAAGLLAGSINKALESAEWEE
jgi:hypothetical protein